MKKPSNPAAFPTVSDGQYDHQEGMTLRDWFAGQAMNGLLANPSTQDVITDMGKYSSDMAIISYLYADAMLAEREKTQ